MVADPTAPERSRWQMFTGQSGHPASPHYDDLQADWLRGAHPADGGRGPLARAGAGAALQRNKWCDCRPRWRVTGDDAPREGIDGCRAAADRGRARDRRAQLAAGRPARVLRDRAADRADRSRRPADARGRHLLGPPPGGLELDPSLAAKAGSTGAGSTRPWRSRRRRTCTCCPSSTAPHTGSGRRPHCRSTSGRLRREWSAFLQRRGRPLWPPGANSGANAPPARDAVPRQPVRTWQIWNEENFFYFARPASPGRYGRLLKLSRAAMQLGDPRLADHRRRALRQPPPAAAAGDEGDRVPRPPLPGARRQASLRRRRAAPVHARHPGSLKRKSKRCARVIVTPRRPPHGPLRDRDRLGLPARHPARLLRGRAARAGERTAPRLRYMIGARHRLDLKQVYWFSWKDAGGCNFCDSVGLFRGGAGFRPKPGLAGLRPHRALSRDAQLAARPATASTISGGAFSGEPESKGGCGVVLDAELNRLGDLRPDLAGDQVQGHVDPGGDTRGGDRSCRPRRSGRRPARRRTRAAVQEEPMRGRALALEQSGGAEHQGAGADRGRPLGRPVDLAQPGEHRPRPRSAAGCRGRRGRGRCRLGRPPRATGRRDAEVPAFVAHLALLRGDGSPPSRARCASLRRARSRRGRPARRRPGVRFPWRHLEAAAPCARGRNDNVR